MDYYLKEEKSNSMSGNADKKSTISLSLHTKILDIIRRESKEKGISINSRINNILRDYVTFYKRAQEFESVTFPKDYFQFVIDNVDEEKLNEYFDRLLSGLIETVLRDFEVPISLENIVKYFLEYVAVKSGGYNSVTHYVDEHEHHCIVLRHSWNIKWSRSACKTLAKYIAQLLHCHYECEALPKSIIIRILEKNIK
jgi:hypothetical protein